MNKTRNDLGVNDLIMLYWGRDVNKSARLQLSQVREQRWETSCNIKYSDTAIYSSCNLSWILYVMTYE